MSQTVTFDFTKDRDDSVSIIESIHLAAHFNRDHDDQFSFADSPAIQVGKPLSDSYSLLTYKPLMWAHQIHLASLMTLISTWRRR